MNKGNNNKLKQSSNYKGKQRTGKYRSPYGSYFWFALVLILVIAALVAFLLKLPLYMAYMLGINIVTLGFYGYDKRQAQRGGWRVPELNLHYLAALGGAVGGLLGQAIFNHKTRKRIFHIVLWSSLLIHILVFLVLNQFFLTFNFDALTALFKQLGRNR